MTDQLVTMDIVVNGFDVSGDTIEETQLYTVVNNFSQLTIDMKECLVGILSKFNRDAPFAVRLFIHPAISRSVMISKFPWFVRQVDERTPHLWQHRQVISPGNWEVSIDTNPAPVAGIAQDTLLLKGSEQNSSNKGQEAVSDAAQLNVSGTQFDYIDTDELHIECGGHIIREHQYAQSANAVLINTSCTFYIVHADPRNQRTAKDSYLQSRLEHTYYLVVNLTSIYHEAQLRKP